MPILKIILIAVGIALIVFGYLIYFRGKYSLINGFEADQKAGRKTEKYAKRVGLTELLSGAVMLAAGIILLFFRFP